MISHTSPIPQWVGDLRARRMLDANQAALTFWRMTLDQFLNLPMEEFFQPEEVPRWETFIEEMKWGESGPWRCTRGDGSIFYCTIRWQMIDYRGVYAAFVFPLRAGSTPDDMVDLHFTETSSNREVRSASRS
jgi:PAS domain-containing protein